MTSEPTEAPRTATAVEWRAVYDDLVAADPETLGAGDLERLAEAAFWVGRPRESIPVRRRLYDLHRTAGDAARAALAAWQLFNDHFDLDETAAANGWLRRAQRHVGELPGSREEGYVALGEAEWARYTGDLDAGVERARHAAEIGEATGDRDLVALSLALQGRVLVMRGDVAEGADLLDETMLAAVGGELTPFATGWVYCVLLHVCSELGDIRRATEWTDIAVRWCDHLGEGGYFPGLCRLHRCEITSFQGAWADAEAEALRATEELAAFGSYMVGEGHYLAGEIRRLRGDVDGALEAFRRAHELGRDPQPGLALVRLARGDAEGAASALRVALASGPAGLVARARLLAAQVEAELRRRNVDAAREAVDELGTIAAEGRTPLLRALAGMSRGALLLAVGEVEQALAALREASTIWQNLSFPYEAAQTRMLLGSATRRAGDEETARLEFEAARAAFERLGAAPDATRSEVLIAAGTSRPRGLTEREAEVLRLVARGRSNREIATELYISEHTVARHLSNIFRKLDVGSRAGATAFAFEHDLA